MIRCVVSLAFVALVVPLALGCKGETKIEDNPKTIKELKHCKEKWDAKSGEVKELKERLAKYELKGQDDPEVVVVNITDNKWDIKGGLGPHARTTPGVPRGNADDDALYKAFRKQVDSARGKMKRCYQTALKKNSAISAMTISLKVQVKFNTAGKPTWSNFSSPIKDANFTTCMKGIVNKWKLPAPPRTVQFDANVTLRPQ